MFFTDDAHIKTKFEFASYFEETSKNCQRIIE